MTYRGHKHIFRHLKQSLIPLSIESLGRRLGVAAGAEETLFKADLERLLKAKYLKTTEDGKIAIRIKLDRVYPKRHVPLRWSPKPKTTTPASFMYPRLSCIASRDQADRGTCVGFASAYKKDCDEVLNTGFVPTAADIAGIRRAVVNADGTITDTLFNESHSAEDPYQNSRRIGNVTYPEGSEIVYAAQALVQVGISYENCQWPTSRTPSATWKTPPAQWAKDVATEEPYHKAVDLAAIDNIADLQAAIATYGSVLIGITVYENYTQMFGGDGTFPEPRGAEVGGHALCAVGFDDHWIYAISSWGQACGKPGVHVTADQQLHRISYNYMAVGFAGAYALIDTEDAKRMVPIGGAPAGVIDFTVSPSSGEAPLMVVFTNKCVGEDANHQVLFTGGGSMIDLKKTPSSPHTYQKDGTFTPQLVVTDMGGGLVGTQTRAVVVTPAPSPTPTPPASLRERILAFLKALIAAIEKRLFGGA